MSSIPEDLRQFLADGRRLSFDASHSELGPIKFYAVEDIRESTTEIPVDINSDIDDPYLEIEGEYQVPALELISESELYLAQGLFCWLPTLSCYAALDIEHGTVLTFPGVDWSMVVADPLKYLEDQWQSDHIGEILLNWEHFPFRVESGETIDPYPDSCTMHQCQLATIETDRHPSHAILFACFQEEWLAAQSQEFRYPGVPNSESEIYGCPECASAERQWMQKCYESIPLAEATINQGGFIKCPSCGQSFSPEDPAAFSNDLCLRCGQRITLSKSTK